jgi:hypothetical protein
MARVGRLAGALLVHTREDYFMVGDTKEPCDFAAAGFDPPGEIDMSSRRHLKLSPRREVKISPPCLNFDLEGEPLAKTLAERLLIDRNGSVSERLWRLVFDPSAEDEVPADGIVGARWLTEMPAEIWAIIRDIVLRCL